MIIRDVDFFIAKVSIQEKEISNIEYSNLEYRTVSF